MDKLHLDPLILLNDLARVMRTEADRRARCHGMTRAQWMILAWLNRTPGLSQRELAEILEVEPITAGRLIDRLEARDLVERRPDPDDRRIWRLHLRAPAAVLLEALAIQRAEMLAIVTGGIPPAALDTAIAVLNQMKANMAASRRPPATLDEKETA
jgi:DNA-binding MarR family transcriptional regulator